MPLRTGAQLERIIPLVAIILLHGLVFYALQNGLTQQAAQAMPRELFVSLIAPAPLPEAAPTPVAPTPPAAKPKATAVVKKAAKPRPTVAREATHAPMPETVEIPIAAAAPSIDPPSPPSPPVPPAPAAQAAPPAPAPALPKTVSGVEYIQAPQPEYPPIARRRGEEGKVILRVLVNEKGRPERIDLRESSGSEHLDEAARRAAARALFKPHLEGGKPVAVYALIPINFSIQ